MCVFEVNLTESLLISMSLGPLVSAPVNSFSARGIISCSLSKCLSLSAGSVTPEFPIPADTNNVNNGVFEFEWKFRNGADEDML